MDRFEKVGGALLRMGAPLFGRLGAFVAGALVTEGVAQEHADLFVNTLGALSVIALDIAFVVVDRRLAARRDNRGIL